MKKKIIIRIKFAPLSLMVKNVVGLMILTVTESH